jgi:hypothetical protein
MGLGETSAMSADTSHEILTSALGLLTATHADRRMAGPVTMDYLAGVPTDRSQMLSLIAGTRGDIGATGAADSGTVLGF